MSSIFHSHPYLQVESFRHTDNKNVEIYHIQSKLARMITSWEDLKCKSWGWGICFSLPMIHFKGDIIQHEILKYILLNVHIHKPNSLTPLFEKEIFLHFYLRFFNLTFRYSLPSEWPTTHHIVSFVTKLKSLIVVLDVQKNFASTIYCNTDEN